MLKTDNYPSDSVQTRPETSILHIFYTPEFLLVDLLIFEKVGILREVLVRSEKRNVDVRN